jgi:DNA-binding GntR family transcriptional regulator
LQFLYAVHTINPILINESHSQLLQLPVGIPAIQLKSVVYTEGNVPIESAFDIYHPDRYQYTVVLRR